MMKKVILLIMGAALALCATARPDFSGTWRFSPELSKLQIPAPGSGVFRVDHREPRFDLSRTFVSNGQEDTFAIGLVTDGREIVTREGDRTIVSHCYWEGDELVFDSLITLKDGRRATNLVHYRLAADGKTLTAVECFRGPALQYDNVWVLVRE